MSNLFLDSTPESEALPERPLAFRYHLLRAALSAGLPGLAEFHGRCRSDIFREADKSFDLESLVLSSPEAAKVAIPPRRLENALSELSGRYPDRKAFLADLAGNGLDEDTLAQALQRELIFDAVMQGVAARRTSATEIDEQLFFELHKDRFNQPERRTARHILVTVNEEYDENRREAALGRIERLAEKLSGHPNRFASLARTHSECPTAMEDGCLGTLSRGRLFAVLDASLFSLPEGGVSPPVESEMGFHLLWCEKIHRARALPFSKARSRIKQLLEERSARNCQKAWIAELKQFRASGSREIEVRQTVFVHPTCR